MQLKSFCVIGQSSFFGRVEHAEINGFVAVFDLCPILVPEGADALQPGLADRRHAPVAGVLLRSAEPQVAAPVIEPISVDVINELSAYSAGQQPMQKDLSAPPDLHANVAPRHDTEARPRNERVVSFINDAVVATAYRKEDFAHEALRISSGYKSGLNSVRFTLPSVRYSSAMTRLGGHLGHW